MRLHVVPAQGAPYDVTFSGEEMVIGRANDCGLAIADRFLSRRHARLIRRDSGVWVEDLGSRNGTLVNGVAIEEPTRLEVGDTIKVSGSLVSVLGADTGHPSYTSQSSLFRRAADYMAEGGGPRSSAGIRDEVALRRLAERLELLNDVHQALARPIASDQLVALVLDRAFAALHPERGAIWLRDATGELVVAAQHNVPGKHGPVIASRNLIEEVIAKGNAALVFDAETDQRFAEAASLMVAGVKSLIAAPLLDAEGTLGMIALESTIHVRQFNEDDLELLVSLASIAALRLRNLALAEEALAMRRMEEELALARRIQRTLLPEQLPELPGWAVVGSSVPSRGVSGDLFKVVRRGEHELVLLIADVSGKGMSAALLSASTEALSAALIEDGLPVAEIADKLSRLLFARTPPEKYVTAILATVDLVTGTFRYTNAGHNPALLVRDGGTVEDLAATGPPLGLLATASYRDRELVLAPGASVVLYTDGITEAANAAGEELGRDRLALASAPLGQGELALTELADAVERMLAEFVGGEPFADDRTLLALRRAPAE
jgi:sigma-B regulation protein RsbU (phosphoserine phosphatase)